MTPLDEQYADLLDGDDDPAFVRLIAQLDALGEGSPSLRGDMMIRHALADHARDLGQQGRSRPAATGEARQHRRVPFGSRFLQARVSMAAAVVAAILLSVGTYLHVQSPTPVSAQTVLHRAAAASPGSNMATHATYRVSSSDGSSGIADVWIGYDGSGAATQLALTLTMSHDGHLAPHPNAGVVAVGPGLIHLYDPGTSPSPAQVPVPSSPGQTTPPARAATSGHPALQPNPSAPPLARACDQCSVLKGMVVGTLLAQKLSSQPTAYKLRQETLNGVSVYALQPADAGNVTYYFNAQTYVLEGADWVQDGASWQARLIGSSTMALSAVPAHTFGAVTGAGQSSGEQGITRVVGPGSGSATQKP